MKLEVIIPQEFVLQIINMDRQEREQISVSLKNEENKSGTVLSEVNNISFNVPIQSKKAFINFVQDFSAKYKGEEVTATVMVTLATAKWRKLSSQEKQLYSETDKFTNDKQNEVDSLRGQIISMEDSDSIFDSD